MSLFFQLMLQATVQAYWYKYPIQHKSPRWLKTTPKPGTMKTTPTPTTSTAQ